MCMYLCWLCLFVGAEEVVWPYVSLPLSYLPFLNQETGVYRSLDRERPYFSGDSHVVGTVWYPEYWQTHRPNEIRAEIWVVMEDGETLLETKWVTLAEDFLQEGFWGVFGRGEVGPKRKEWPLRSKGEKFLSNEVILPSWKEVSEWRSHKTVEGEEGCFNG